MQDRLGPNRVGVPLADRLKDLRLFGLGQPLADGVKFIFKEEYTPAMSKSGCLSWPRGDSGRRLAVFAVIPFGSFIPAIPNVWWLSISRSSWSSPQASMSA